MIEEGSAVAFLQSLENLTDVFRGNRHDTRSFSRSGRYRVVVPELTRLSGLSGGFQDELSDLVRMRDQREVA
jgi:hypothetical protein